MPIEQLNQFLPENVQFTPQQMTLLEPFVDLILAAKEYRVRHEDAILDEAYNGSGFFREIMSFSGLDIFPDGILVKTVQGKLKSQKEVLDELDKIVEVLDKVYLPYISQDTFRPGTPQFIRDLADLNAKISQVQENLGYFD